MANLRNLKKEIDYRLEEVVFDCDMAICFQPSKEKEIFEVMQEAVGVRNDLFAKAMIFSYDITAEQMGDWAAMMGIEAVYIDKDTTIRNLKNELRWNELAFRK